MEFIGCAKEGCHRQHEEAALRRAGPAIWQAPESLSLYGSPDQQSR